MENAVNRSLTRDAPFLVDGRERGSHRAARSLVRDTYVVHAHVDGRLPALLAIPHPRAHPDRRDGGGLVPSTTRPPGVRQLADWPVDAWLRISSAGVGFAAALLGADDGLYAALQAALPSLHTLEVTPAGARTSIVVTTGWTPERCLVLAEALVRRADALVAGRRSFRDVGARTGAGVDDDDDGRSPAAVERLLADVAAGTAWLNGHAARAGSAVEARLSLAEAGFEHAATLRVGWQDSLAAVVDVHLVGECPLTPGTMPLTLRPQLGIAGRLASWFERTVGDAALDEAFVIRGDPLHAPAVRAARRPLLGLAAARAQVCLADAHVDVRVPPAARAPAELRAVIDDALELWRIVVSARG